MMSKTTLPIILMLLSYNAHAGIETILLDKGPGDCIIRITHDATPSSKTGAIVFRSFKPLNGVHEPCPPQKDDVSTSLSSAFEVYRQKQLKPATSIFIGRLIHYPWIVGYLAGQGPALDKTTGQNRSGLFNSRVFLDEVLAPFQIAIAKHHYKISKTECEKILVNRRGIITDALCWLVIEPLPGK